MWTILEADRYIQWTQAMFTLDLAISWLVTLMIIWRLYRVGYRAMAIAGRKSNRYLNIILALVESGMFSSVVMGVFVALIYAQMVSRILYVIHCSLSWFVRDPLLGLLLRL